LPDDELEEVMIEDALLDDELEEVAIEELLEDALVAAGSYEHQDELAGAPAKFARVQEKFPVKVA
jgi:hypothetical protein